MIFAPARMINKNEMRINIVDNEECLKNAKKIINNNKEIKEFKEVID